MNDFASRLKSAMKQVEQGSIITDTNVAVTSEWIDPRAHDLPDDSMLWGQLLQLVKYDAELYSSLDSLRESGALLKKQSKMYKMVPYIDPTGRTGHESEANWNELKLHLEHKKEAIIVALTQLHQRCGGR
jgi:hypothetical protein